MELHWELTVLSRAVHYKNLSSAADHVRLSQPQLSRIVSRLEAHFGIILLDRTARRKSGWTAEAHRLAEVYQNSMKRLKGEIQQFVRDAEPEEISLGCLEGMIPVANEIGRRLLENSHLRVLEINVFDLNVLEENFLKGDLDLICTSREPGRKKYSHIHPLGYQWLEKHAGKGGPRVMSSWESNVEKKTGTMTQTVVSNSLQLRKDWILKHKGEGTIPSEVSASRTSIKNPTPLFLIGTELINKKHWNAAIGLEK